MVNKVANDLLAFCQQQGLNNIYSIEPIEYKLNTNDCTILNGVTSLLINGHYRLDYIAGTPFTDYYIQLKNIQ